jgi:hypothetical protein
MAKPKKSITRKENGYDIKLSLFLRSYLHRVEIVGCRDSMYHMTARHIAHISTWELTHRWDWRLLQYWVPQRLIVDCSKRGKNEL